MRYSYYIEHERGGQWIRVFGAVSKEYARGYLYARSEMPGPRLATRIVRSDGQVLESVGEVTKVSVGVVAGFPTAEQYRAAAARALEMAEAIEEHEKRRLTHNG